MGTTRQHPLSIKLALSKRELLVWTFFLYRHNLATGRIDQDNRLPPDLKFGDIPFPQITQATHAFKCHSLSSFFAFSPIRTSLI
jgi:hypothetical protein